MDGKWKNRGKCEHSCAISCTVSDFRQAYLL